MDNLSQQIIEKIKEKDISRLTDWDIAFLRARRSYLSMEELEKYDTFLSDVKTNQDKKVVSKKK